MSNPDCDFDHPHPNQPCGRRIIDGITRCAHCGNLDGSSECDATGCWQPATEDDLDELYAEALGLNWGGKGTVSNGRVD